MIESSPRRKPRFRLGDRVRAVGPSVRAHRNDSGVVTEIFGPPDNAVYRYRVAFDDGVSQTFFGFELRQEESKAA